MKTQAVLIIFSLLNIQLITGQIRVSCGDDPITVDTENNILFYNTSDCNEDLKITTENEDVQIEGIIEVNKNQSLFIIGNENYSINIKPLYTSTSNKTVVSTSEKTLPDGSRTKLGVNEKESKEDDDEITKTKVTIYPNPADDELNIQINKPILNYLIYDGYGVIYLQGNTTTISVAALQTGLYYIKIQTETETIIQTFYKN